MTPTSPPPLAPARRFVLFCLLAGALLTGAVLGGTVAGAQETPQDDRSQGLVLPVQTVVDAFPVLVDEAIEEAEFDGKPNRAEALLAQMEAYVANFSKPLVWPEGSTADQVAYQEALLFAADVVALAQIVPDMAARVEIVRASCDAFETASADEAKDWLRDVREGRVDLGALLAGLEDTKRALPVAVDTAPLERGISSLQDWGNGSLEVSLACSEEAAIFFDVYEPDDRLTFFARPTVTWPTASVQFFGAVGSDTDADEVSLSGAGLGLDRSVAVGENGGFHVRHVVPRETSLDDHGVVAMAGGHEENVTVSVEKAPTSLVLEYPKRVEPGASFTLRVRLLDPLVETPEAAEVAASGDREAVIVLEGGEGSVQWSAPEETGVLQGSLAYAGDEIRAPSTASYRIQVQEEVVAGVPPDRVGSGDESFFGNDRGLVETVLIVVVSVLLAWALLLVAVRFWRGRRSRRGASSDGGEEIAPDVRGFAQGLGTSFIRVFIGLHAWCIRQGLVPPGATARDMTRSMGSPTGLRRATREFERVRYGGAPEKADRSRGALKSTLAAWRDGVKRFVQERSR